MFAIKVIHNHLGDKPVTYLARAYSPSDIRSCLSALSHHFIDTLDSPLVDKFPTREHAEQYAERELNYYSSTISVEVVKC